MTITLPVGSYATNAYIYFNEGSRAGVIIDPAADAAVILAKVKEHGLNIRGILLTHGHFDHIGAVDEVRHALGVPVYATRHDANLANDAALNGTGFFGMRSINVTVDNFITSGPLDLEGLEIQALATPGHTLGSLCFYVPAEDVLFSGDTLFKQSYGRYDLPTGDYTALTASLDMLLAMPAQTVVYPGHGPATTIGYEQTNNMIRK